MARFGSAPVGIGTIGGGASAPSFYGGRMGAPPSAEGEDDAGEFSIDLSAPDWGLGEDLANAAGLIGGLGGDVLGAIGGIGIPGGPNIGDIPEAAGEALGAVGRIPLPTGTLPTNPVLGTTLGGGGEANVGAIPGAMLDVLGLLGRGEEREFAERRIEESQNKSTGDSLTGAEFLARLRAGGRSPTEALVGQTYDPLPTDLQDELDSGTMTPDEVADELVARGAGFSNSPITNLAAGIAYDPMNLISAGVGAIRKGAQRAGETVRVGVDASAAERMVGEAYSAATHGLTAGQQVVARRFFGPTTSGVFHALGTKPYQHISTELSGLGPTYANAFDRALALGAAQLPRAVIARQMGDEASDLVRRGFEVADKGDAPESILARLQARKAIDPARVERDTEELLLAVAPDFAGRTPESIRAEAVAKLASIIDGSPEDAARVLGDRVSEQTARTIHLAYYGHAGDALVRAKSAAGLSKAIDVERLTLIAEDTLTAERADDLLAVGGDAMRAAVSRYSILANRFSGHAFDEAKVRAFVSKLRDEGALPEAVRVPKSGKHALPGPLAEWRAKFAPSYDLGFAPKDGWKVVMDADGNVIASDPFVAFVSDATPLTVRNPLGRFIDSLFRGTTQTAVILDSRARMVKLTAGLGVSPNEARSIHRVILEAAREEGVAPRGLAFFGSKPASVAIGGKPVALRLNAFDEAFRKVLGDERFGELIVKHDPTVLIMKAFEGNLSRVGLTQKLTGKAKSLPLFGGGIAAITEGIYPAVRFRLNLLFQGQEAAEDPFWNLLRGIESRAMDPDLAKVYQELGELPEFRYISESGYFLNIAGGEAIKRSFGRGKLAAVIERFPDVRAAKERARLAQALSEHGEAFHEAMDAVNPRLWRTMVDAYGTDDAGRIADAFLRERVALTSNLDSAMSTFDKLPALEGADAQRVWQAFRESFRQVSEQAFTTHYFNPSRGWLERTLNHPFLGLYPLSYMRKVTGEMARFLIVRPFGKNAPAAGLEGLLRVQQAVVGAMADPEFSQFIEDHPDALWLMQALVPAVPTDIPVNAPGWARGLAEGQSPEQAIGRSADYAIGVIRGPRTIAEGALDLGDAMADVFSNLDKAAAMFDGMGNRP